MKRARLTDDASLDAFLYGLQRGVIVLLGAGCRYCDQADEELSLFQKAHPEVKVGEIYFEGATAVPKPILAIFEAAAETVDEETATQVDAPEGVSPTGFGLPFYIGCAAGEISDHTEGVLTAPLLSAFVFKLPSKTG